MPISRRNFVRASATAAGVLAVHPSALATSTRNVQPIRVGLIGCGGRGSGAARQSLGCAEGVTLVAMGDVFADQVAASRDNLRQSDVGDKVQVADDACFSGLDAYKQVIHHPDVDLVIHATAPNFRPQHLAEAVAARKHSFVEKPVCVDPVGYRSILATEKKAREAGVAIVTGTQFRRANNYVEAIEAIHGGAIGDILFAQARYCASGIWYRPRVEGMTDAEYQLHNWYHFLWLCGDQIVEQAIHNVDAMNWAMGSPPERCLGSGGHRARPEDSEVYDCMSVDFEYPNGATCSFMCRQQGGKTETSNRIVGTKGTAWIMPFGTSTITGHDGSKIFEVSYEGDAYVQEHIDLIASIRAGQPIIEAREVADSSLTGVMGRMAAYTGEEVTWDFVTRESVLDLMPAELTLQTSFEPRPVPAPGREKLI